MRAFELLESEYKKHDDTSSIQEFTKKQTYNTYRVLNWNYDNNGPTTVRSVINFNPGEDLQTVKNIVNDANFKFITIERKFPTTGWRYVEGIKIDNAPHLSEGKFSLYEYDIGKISKLQPLLNNIIHRDKSIPDEAHDDVNGILKLANLLDTKYHVKSGELIYWILSRFLKGSNKWEDIPSRIVPKLEKFQKLKNKKLLPVEIRDINKIKTFGEFEDIVDKFDHTELLSNKDEEKRIEQQFYDTGQALLMYNDSNIKIVSPETEAASCFFGRNTRWCTAAKQDNMFDQYNTDGPLYIVLLKKENKRYQFHWGDYDQFMNELDQEINPNELANEYPILWKIFQPIARKHKSIYLDPEPTEEAQMNALNAGIDIFDIIDYNKIYYDVLMEIIKHNPEAVKYYHDQDDEDFQLDAINNNHKSYEWLKNPTSEAKRLYKEYGFGRSQYED